MDTIRSLIYLFTFKQHKQHKDQMKCFSVVEVNCPRSVFSYNQTHLNTEEDQDNEQILVEASKSLHLFTFCNDDIVPGKKNKTFLSVDFLTILTTSNTQA